MRAPSILTVVVSLLVELAPSVSSTDRVYFIATDLVEWDYAPLGWNVINDMDLQETGVWTQQNSDDRIGTRYQKAIYREYTDETFTTLKHVPQEELHKGILGPILRAEVGDRIIVLFKNNLPSQSVSMHPHGVEYDKQNEGAFYFGDDFFSDGDAVAPGQTFEYRWNVPEHSGPTEKQGSSILWTYHSHVDPTADINAGLIGPIVVSRKGCFKSDRPSEVDIELFGGYVIYDENVSFLYELNRATYLNDTSTDVDTLDDMVYESNVMHSINGFVFGNLPALNSQTGDRVRWYIFGYGNEGGLHTPHWHGQSLKFMNQRVDVVNILPATMLTLDSIPTQEGVWLFHCHVEDHLEAGMVALYNVTEFQGERTTVRSLSDRCEGEQEYQSPETTDVQASEEIHNHEVEFEVSLIVLIVLVALILSYLLYTFIKKKLSQSRAPDDNEIEPMELGDSHEMP